MMRPYSTRGAGVVPLGSCDGAGEVELVWDALATGSLLVEARLGTGLSNLLRTLVRHALAHPEAWQAVVVSRASWYPAGVRSVLRAAPGDDAEVAEVLGDLVDLANTRRDALDDLGARDITALDALGDERPRRILVAIDQPASYPERVVEHLGRLVRLGRTTGIHVAALGGRTALLPAALRDGFGARAALPDMLSGRVSYSECGDPIWGRVRDTSARELEELVALRGERRSGVRP